uniref:Uncharacterized protein n=1 Tax=Tetranychus urticae TaxID=32264 RepID=T1JXT0_TETUR
MHFLQFPVAVKFIKAVLISVPKSQDAVFGKTECEEILSRMEETGSDCCNYKPEEWCERLMRNVLNNLAKLKNPWICAHGRPTVRFLFNINEIIL